MNPTKYNSFQKKFQNADLSYCAPDLKKSFHRAAKGVLKQLAADLGIEGDLRSNMAGIAVSGEITLHSDALYVQISQSWEKNKIHFLVRSCKGRKDYSGGMNNFHRLTNEYQNLFKLCENILDAHG